MSVNVSPRTEYYLFGNYWWTFLFLFIFIKSFLRAACTKYSVELTHISLGHTDDD